ncbi:VCBS domain-containing protein, partial [Vibrio diazotrophicus]|uniref:VCBS domain-containing protein n=1 Tax=Vibrio diazotrophicus TaxID=685 RepID=UPI00142DC282
MAKDSLFSIASLAVNQMIVIDKNGDLKIATIGEKLPEGSVVIQRGDEAGFNNEPTTQLVGQNNELQDVTDDVAQLIAALEDGQDPTQIDEELAPAAGTSLGSSPTDSASIERAGPEIIARTDFSTSGFESIGFSQTQSLALINLNRSNANANVEAADKNSDPKAQNDTISVDEDTSVTIDVLSNDTDKDGDLLTIESATVPQEQGTVVIVDEKLVFTPAENYNGKANIEYSISDGQGGTDTAKVTVTVNPVNDDPTIVVDNAGHAATGSITEDGVLVDGVVSTTTLSGSVSARDVDDTSLTWTTTGDASLSDADAATLAANKVSASELGTFTLDEDGNWTFELDTDKTQFLDDGESLTLTYAVSVSDGDASDSKSVTITITGSNDAPIIVVDNAGHADTGSITEDGVLVDGVVSTTTLSGSVSASDEDDTSLSWTSTGTASVSDEDAATLAANNVSASELGTFTLDANGNWTFELKTGNTQFLDDGESLTLTYPVSVSDGDASNSKPVTITITGTNDSPIIDVDNEGYADTGSITEDGVLVDGVVSTTTLSGSVSASDKDDTSLSWTSTGTASVSDEDAATLAANKVSASELGTFTLDEDGNWTFELDTDNTQFLDDGDSLTLTYAVSVSDGDASDTESVTITITGTNDAPIIDVDNEGYADTGSITEDGVLVDGVVSTTTLSGSVSASDEDDTSLSWTSTGTASVSDEDAATLAANNVSTADLGTFTLDANGNWTFELDTDNTQFLDDGESLTLTYPVSVSDGDASDTESVTITITGTNDAP